MRILLIHAGLPEVGNVAKPRRALFPSLTLTHVAALFPREYDITLCNEIVDDIPFEENFDLVGITFYGVAAARAFAIAKRFRERGICVLFGGPTVTSVPELCRPHADSLLIGEAETVLPELVSDLERRQLKAEYVAADVANIADLPVPRYDLLDRNRYVGIYPVQTARGCVFRCSFCTIPQLSNYTQRYRPIDQVVRDIQAAVAASGKRQIYFVDDNINMNPSRAIELFQALIPLKIEWYSYATTLIGKQPKVLKLAAESGCRMLFIGFETLKQKTLNNVNKPFNHPSDFKECIAAIHDHGIHIMPSFMFGFDDDDPGIFQRTFDFIEANRLSFPLGHIFTPAFGTEPFERMQMDGRIFETDLARFDCHHVVFQPAGMSAEELQQGYDWIMGSLYSLPSILRRTILSQPKGGWRGLIPQLQVVIFNLQVWYYNSRLAVRPGVPR